MAESTSANEAHVVEISQLHLYFLAGVGNALLLRPGNLKLVLLYLLLLLLFISEQLLSLSRLHRR